MLPVAIFVLSGLAGCKVYTINKSDFESGLKSRQGKSTGLAINSLYRKQYKNHLDTIVCANDMGQVMKRKLGQDSKITIYTTSNKTIRYYVKTLYIYKDEYLIGERTAPKLYGPNYFPIKLSDIDRIEVKGY
jgi:hypothetical protein